jgi:multicomponent Na+:H+ antiporter subunit A
MADVTALTFAALCMPFLGAVLAPFVVRALARMPPGCWRWLPCWPSCISSVFCRCSPHGEVVRGGYAWVPSLNLPFSWLLDGLSLTFALLITGIGALIVLYAGGYLKGHPDQGRFFRSSSCSWARCSASSSPTVFLMLFVFWELTSITSFLLIGFDHRREAARRAALQALVVTGGGGLLPAGRVAVDLEHHRRHAAFGALAIWRPAARQSRTTCRPAAVLGGAFTKSAQFPFHFWLPNAMEAPTPVSAYLHSATMVKAGVYLLMRLNPAMGGTPAWEHPAALFGGVTLIVGTLLAIRQTDLKLKLAYTTVSSLGLLVLLTGFGTPYAIEAAVLYLVAHSLFKGALFMVAGIIDHETGTRDITRLSGLRGDAADLCAACRRHFDGRPAAVLRLPRQGGDLYSACPRRSARIVTIIAVLRQRADVRHRLRRGAEAVPRRPVETPKHPHEAPPLLWLGPVVLALLGLLAALFSAPAHRYISSPMASAVSGSAAEIEISLVPHIGLPLLLSLVTVHPRHGRLLAARPGPQPDGRASCASSARVPTAASTMPSPACAFRRPRHPHCCSPGGWRSTSPAPSSASPPSCSCRSGSSANCRPGRPGRHDAGPRGGVILLAAIGLVAVLVARDRLTAIVSLGIQGFAVALIFLLFGAPDLPSPSSWSKRSRSSSWRW